MVGCAARGELYYSVRLFGAYMSLRSAIHRTMQTSLRDLTNTRVNIRPIPPIYCFCGFYCLSHDLKLLAKPSLEKQTIQLSLVMQHCMGIRVCMPIIHLGN